MPGPWDVLEPAPLEADCPVTPEHREGRLASRPGAPTVPGSSGIVSLGVVGKRDTLVFVPDAIARPAPLIVALHGAGGDPRGTLAMLGSLGTDTGAILLAPGSRDRSWDVIVGHVGPDVAVLDRSLRVAFDRWAVDRLVIAGFSDGASYALTLGLANGDLFRHVLAFSPGFALPPRHVGTPAVFVSHGLTDAVLPIDRCSRRLVPRLRREGYEVNYREFREGHTIPRDVAREALVWAGLLKAGAPAG